VSSKFLPLTGIPPMNPILICNFDNDFKLNFKIKIKALKSISDIYYDKLIFLNSLKSISQIIKIKLLEDIINEQSHFV